MSSDNIREKWQPRKYLIIMRLAENGRQKWQPRSYDTNERATAQDFSVNSSLRLDSTKRSGCRAEEHFFKAAALLLLQFSELLHRY